ncbi:MAG TPA: GNAT family N-acetyltransferase, partial [Actinomycetota bacterium]|nr:GNAT family N-acetyltransferase [Actinomycetota bacterium]
GMMWWVFAGPGGLDPGLHRAFLGRGFKLETDRPSMTLELPSRPQPSSNGVAEILRVSDDESYREWARVVGDAFGNDDYPGSISATAFRRFGFDDDAPYRHYLARVGARGAAVATVCTAGGAAGLSNIGTRREFRRRGVASATIDAALRDAEHLGLATAVLSADPDGIALYERLGFTTVGRHLTYLWRP